MVAGACLVLLTALAGSPQEAPLSYGEGRAASAEQGKVLLVLVHGSDWLPVGERLLRRCWREPGFGAGVGAVLADVDVLQSGSKRAREANAARNKGWDRKASGVRTFPAVVAYAPDGAVIGALQGAALDRDPATAGSQISAFARRCQRWVQLGGEILAAREGERAGEELASLVERETLGLVSSKGLMDALCRLDPKDAAGHAARASFPSWTDLVARATADGKAGKGAEVRQRLEAMLGNPAYTADQRAVVHLALGAAYRRWEGHDRDAGASFRAAWKTAPETIAGRAGMRLYLRGYGGPSLVQGWNERHTRDEDRWWALEDVPRRLEPGSYRLRLRLTRGSALAIVGYRLMSSGGVLVSNEERTWISKESPVHEIRFSVTQRLTDVAVEVRIGRGGGTRGTLEWSSLP